MKPKLYETDFYQWINTTVEHLKQGELEKVDWSSLIEELESMGRAEKQALKSNLVIIMIHLLKYAYQPDKQSKSWLASIEEHRRTIEFALEDSHSLKRVAEEAFQDCYFKARKGASIETELSIKCFPDSPPFNLEEVLGDWLPT